MTSGINPETLPAKPHLRHETALWANGALWIAGIDETGRGALAGPVLVAAVILPQMAEQTLGLAGVRDSKQMTPAQRSTWSTAIRNSAVSWGVGLATAPEIDALGIAPATRLAATRAIQALKICPDYLLLDYFNLPEVPIPQIALIKGDRHSLSIAAASVVAKTTRDDILVAMDRHYPGYGFAEHKGYGTESHRAAIECLGPSPVHRLSFAPLNRISVDVNTLPIYKMPVSFARREDHDRK
ncbi:MAG: ribonuclease HII [Anaerolineales bacterium]|nr:ribonuclease HII [Anaerolineales bacterium]